jgi:uncharacterized protein (DUF1778 family)
MNHRDALLIRCSKQEAQTIHERARRERRSLSAYVLEVMGKTLNLEDKLLSHMSQYGAFNRVLSRIPVRTPGPRTEILVRCSDAEARRIRAAARRRDVSISGFVLHALRRSWAVADEMKRIVEHANDVRKKRAEEFPSE